MTIIYDIFYIVIFVSFMGSIYSLLALLVRKALHIILPLGFDVCGIVLFFFPLIAPTLWLIPPEHTVWVNGFIIANFIWLLGLIVSSVYYITRFLLSRYALKNYYVCCDQHINQIYNNCLSIVGVDNPPALYFGTLYEPACVVTLFRPAVILNETTINHLTDKELEIILCHELMHIQRRHHVYQRFFDFISIIHWFNPFVWTTRNDFNAHCEMDCDQKVLSVMNGKVTEIEYASAMLHLMELSLHHRRSKATGMAALGFLNAKQRLIFILNKTTSGRRRIGIAVLAFLTAMTMLFSIYVSRSYFYPYPAFVSEPEHEAYSDAIMDE